MKRWNPRVEPTKRELLVLKRLTRVRKLFGFLRMHRHELFDESFQTELEGMYRSTGAGIAPIPPALMCMVVLLQAYVGASDAEAVELSVVDLRWQLVLDCIGAEKPLFSQGSLQQFRERLIAADMDRRVLERTVEVAKSTKEFDWKKLPKSLRVAVDSRPLAGAGRVEDTINLLGHAGRKIAELVAQLSGQDFESVCRRAGAPLLLNTSIKAGLDLDWSDPRQKAHGLAIVEKQMSSLYDWVDKYSDNALSDDSVERYASALQQTRSQDLDIDEVGTARIRDGVAPDRRVSIEDEEMRHGRKSKSKRFNGYKEHIASDVDTGLILSCAVTPANRPEEEAADDLFADIGMQNRRVSSMHIDRAYLNSNPVKELVAANGDVICKPWPTRNYRPGLFSKADFKIDVRSNTITCPAGEVEDFEPGQVVQFDPEVCGACPLRSSCTHSASGRGRTVSMVEDEALQKKLRALQTTKAGRAKLRERTKVEHNLAHISQRKGPRARYIGTRRNLFDLRRASAITNMEAIQRKLAA